MRVLIITQWFPPEPAKLVLELAQTLGEFGHSVEVLTGFPNYPAGELYSGYRLRLSMRERVDGVDVVRVWLYPEHSRSAVMRMINYGSFALSAALLGPLRVRRPDVIFVYGSPYTTAFPARLMRLLWRTPYVFNVQDLWPESLSSTGMVGRHLSSVTAGIARFAYRRAAAIIAISRGFADRIVGTGVPAERVHVIPNWVDIEHYAEVAATAELRHPGVGKCFVVLYAGTIGRPQALDAVIDAAALIRHRRHVCFVFVGDGIERPRLEEKSRELGLTNVHFIGRVPESEMPSRYAMADAVLVHLASDPMLNMTIPHKIYTYMAIGKPIVAAVAGDAADLVRETNSGVVCSPGDPGAVADAVEHLASLSAQQREALGRNGRNAACSRFARKEIVREIADVLEQAGRRKTMRGAYSGNEHRLHKRG